MLNCKQASVLASQALDRNLPWRERLALRLHLLLCDACREFKRQIEFLQRAATRGADKLPGLSTMARERMRQAVRENAP